MVQSIVLTYPNSSRTVYTATVSGSAIHSREKEFAERLKEVVDMLFGTALLKSEYQIEIKIKPGRQHVLSDEPVFKIMDGFLNGNPKLFSILRQLAEKRIFPEAGALERLSPMQRKIACLVRQGLTYREIADKLCISPHTVNGHRKNALRVLGVANSKELTSYLERFDRC